MSFSAKSVLLLLACLAGSGCSQTKNQQELSIGNIEIPSFRWGKQVATFEVTNNSDWMKYITVETEIRFEGSYLHPVRIVHTHYPLIPGEPARLSPEIDVPGNFGKASLFIRLYDVVDTLDELMSSQIVYEQPFKLTFHVPEAAFEYMQEKVLLPPTVDNNPVWDSEAAHLLPILLNEGKSLEEIASLLEADVSFIEQMVGLMTGWSFLEKRSDGSVAPLFPVFLLSQAEETKKVVEQTSDRLAELIVGNLGNYRAVLDSMVGAGSLTTDSNDFIHGGTVLYRPYPVVSTLLLWYHLGQKFIEAGDPLVIFRGTNPCHALLGQFMYAVQGGDLFNGHHYYYSVPNKKGIEITYGDQIPDISCPENLAAKSFLRERADFTYSEDHTPEVFLVSAILVKPALNALGNGSDELFQESRDELASISKKHGQAIVSVGERYWFWNQVATRTLEKLVQSGSVERAGNGMFKLSVTN